jgi:hypothetical protein
MSTGKQVTNGTHLRRLHAEEITLRDFVFAKDNGAKHNREVFGIHLVLICMRGNAGEMFHNGFQRRPMNSR